MARTKHAAAAHRAAPIRFRGVPASLTGVVADRVDASTAMAITMRGYPTKDASLELSTYTDADPRIIRVAVPSSVAPGIYEGTLTIDGDERAVELEVEPSPQLRVVPEQLRVEARPGDVVRTNLTMLNSGNEPVNVRRVQAFGIFMEGGVERALRRAYVRTLEATERRVDIIADNLAAAHGGLVRMTITEGAGSIEPGAVQPLDVELKIPAELDAGSIYSGNWEMPGLVYPVRITVPGEPRADTNDENGGASGTSETESIR